MGTASGKLAVQREQRTGLLAHDLHLPTGCLVSDTDARQVSIEDIRPTPSDRGQIRPAAVAAREPTTSEGRLSQGATLLARRSCWRRRRARRLSRTADSTEPRLASVD